VDNSGVKSGKSLRRVPERCTATAQELALYTELGMRSAALAVVEEILTKRTIRPSEFSAASIALGVFCWPIHVRKWMDLLEVAYERQPPKTKRAIKRDLLRSRGIDDPLNALFTMELFLENERVEEARNFAEQCERALADEQRPLLSCICRR